MKVCSNCKESKPLSEFHKSKKYSDGCQLWCKVCANIHGAFMMRKRLAKKKSISFELSFSEYYQLRMASEKCPITNESFRKQGNGNGLDSATLDRIDPNKGYVIGNVAFLSRKANNVKSTLSSSKEAEEIFNAILKYMKSHGI